MRLDERPYDQEAVSFAARRAETKWNLPPHPPFFWVKETSPGLFLTGQQKKTIFCSWYFPGVDMCNSPWKHFHTLRGFLKEEFPQHLSSRSQSDLEFLSPSQSITEWSSDWRETNPWDVNLPGIMVFLSCSPLPSFKSLPFSPCLARSSFPQLTIRRLTSTCFFSVGLHFSLSI